MTTESRSRIRSRAKSLTAAQRQLMDQLVDLREKHGLSQAEVARRMGVHQSSVARFEAYDSNPTFSTLRRYALAIEARLRLEAFTDNGSDYAPSESTAAGSQTPQHIYLVTDFSMGSASNLNGWKFEPAHADSARTSLRGTKELTGFTPGKVAK